MHASVSLFPTNISRNFYWQELIYLGETKLLLMCVVFILMQSHQAGVAVVVFEFCLRILNYLLFCFLFWCVV